MPQDRSFQVTYLNDDIAKDLLLDCKKAPTEEEVSAIIDLVKGYPLILMILKAAIENDDFTWGDIIEDIHKIKDYTDNANEKISHRIIGRFSGILKEELAWIASLNNSKISRHFLQEAIGKNGILSLQKRSLISIQDTNYYTVHQLILDSIKDVVPYKEFESKQLSTLLQYLIKNNEIKSLSFYTFLFNHATFVNSVYEKLSYDDELKKAILYSLLQANDYYSNPEWALIELNQINFDLKKYSDLLLYIEKAEIELYQLKTDSAEYEELGNAIISILKNILSSIDSRSKLVVDHHIGKIYAKQRKYSEAKEFLRKFWKSILRLIIAFCN